MSRIDIVFLFSFLYMIPFFTARCGQASREPGEDADGDVLFDRTLSFTDVPTG
jgi:hypothetical protein